ncbi:LLM class flavin-dependent oxidoreductase [Conexibacter sp. CPCC 206217]|uniref:LLM class flavin-dependent oxidoreductase n=1 Tax=Conexibacter sp. CPCC 206217 TaxID=3064574 RepID=UPI0027162FA0|nr:LLM class flavin-dependent oxidoreductase [Conexibacter sp. CPCC 206217]MDO8212058.1 LLM class flavin-dependent oxidoreductase [Conexibacter sp. CPCC 206217]
MEVFWTLGGSSDGPHPWNADGRWRSDIRRLAQVAMAIDRLPFSGALLAIGVPGTYDPFTVAASVAPLTERMRFLIAVYPGLITPTQLALMSLSLDQLSAGRLMLNVVGSNPVTMAAHGVHLEKADRYEMLDDYWRVFRALYAGEAVPESRFFPVRDPETFLGLEPVQRPCPPLWGASGSPEGLGRVISLVDTYLSHAGTPQELAQRTGAARAVAAEQGRPTPSFGVSLGVLVRETEEEAWAEAERKLGHISPETIAGLRGYQAAQAAGRDAADEREGRVMDAIASGRRPAARDLEFHPNMWTGPAERVGIDVRRQLPLPGTMLIGSAEQVAQRMKEIERLAGIERFILWAPPTLEEAYRVADLLLPLLDLDAQLAPPVPSLGAARPVEVSA